AEIVAANLERDRVLTVPGWHAPFRMRADQWDASRRIASIMSKEQGFIINACPQGSGKTASLLAPVHAAPGVENILVVAGTTAARDVWASESLRRPGQPYLCMEG